MVLLCALNLAGSQAAGAYMHSLCSAVYFAFHAVYVRVPDRIAPSMRMAYIIAEMNAFTTNITLSHFYTS